MNFLFRNNPQPLESTTQQKLEHIDQKKCSPLNSIDTLEKRLAVLEDITNLHSEKINDLEEKTSLIETRQEQMGEVIKRIDKKACLNFFEILIIMFVVLVFIFILYIIMQNDR